MAKDGEQWHETPAFGVSVTRNSSMTFKLPLEAGETEVLSELLKKYILESFVVADAYQSQKSNYQSKKPEEPQQEIAEDDDYGVPF
jgi:hypothetical protein